LGLDELIRTLKDNEQKQIDDIWRAARNEADSLRRQVAEAIEAVTEKHSNQLASACQKSSGAIFSEAAGEARGRKLLAYQTFEQAVQQAAGQQLSSLREMNYEAVFTRLVKELPKRQWEAITVNPADTELAARFFSADIIRSAPGISGGLIASAVTGRFVVDNTFEKRLERKWFSLLPTIIENISEQYGGTGSAHKTE